MKYSELTYLIRSDLYRYTGKVNKYIFIRNILFSAGFKYSFWMRVCTFLREHFIWKYLLYRIAYLILVHYRYKYGITIQDATIIGSGFYISYFGCIVVNSRAIIGKNCNISNGVTIAQANRGKRKGTPTIGDNVYIGPGAKIIGNVKVGNGVAIGANCVVTKDIPDNAVVVGVPGKVISFDSSLGYINRTDY
jgi:serine O-acetyltransferase